MILQSYFTERTFDLCLNIFYVHEMKLSGDSMNAQKQHFVPEVYLRQFTRNQNGFFYQLDISIQRLDIREVHVHNVCYFTNYYDVENQGELRELGLNDPRYLEKSFTYENILAPIIDRIRERQYYSSRKEFEILVDA